MRFTLFTLANWTASIANLFLAPLVVIFASELGWLPRWLWWFQTPDNPLDGDDGWAEHRPYRDEDAYWKQYVNRVFWLYRNSMYGLSEDVLGFTVEPGFTYTCEGDEMVSNHPLVNGLVRRSLTSGGTTYWQWYYVKAWSATRCLRINLGWKLWSGKQVGDKVSIVFSVNPFMGYSKGSK